MFKEPETNDQMLIHYLRQDLERMQIVCNDLIKSNNDKQGKIEIIIKTLEGIEDCADETDMRKEIEESIKQYRALLS